MATRITIVLEVDGLYTEGLLKSAATRASEDVFRVNNDPVLFIAEASSVEEFSPVEFFDHYVDQVQRGIINAAHYKYVDAPGISPSPEAATAQGIDPSTGVTPALHPVPVTGVPQAVTAAVVADRVEATPEDAGEPVPEGPEVGVPDPTVEDPPSSIPEHAVEDTSPPVEGAAPVSVQTPDTPVASEIITPVADSDDQAGQTVVTSTSEPTQ